MRVVVRAGYGFSDSGHSLWSIPVHIFSLKIAEFRNPIFVFPELNVTDIFAEILFVVICICSFSRSDSD